MDHRYIDDFSVAERYVENALRPEERSAFEAHLVDCQECTDRLILAGMFYTRNGVSKAAEPPVRTGLVVRLKLWQIVLLCAATALLLLAIPIILIPVWKLLSK